MNSIIVKLPRPTEDDVAVFDETERWLYRRPQDNLIPDLSRFK
jgi:hypothetical protein